MAEGQQCPPTIWESRELHVLIAAKKDQHDLAADEPSRERMRTSEDRWREVEAYCRAARLNRNAKQCKKRWEKLHAEFKKVFDYHTQKPRHGEPGYFQLTTSQRKQNQLPRNFPEDLYDAMDCWVPEQRAVNPDPSRNGVQSNSAPTNAHGTSETSERTTVGRKRKSRHERTANELQKLTQHFVNVIAEDRVARREEHREILGLEERKHVDTLELQREAIRAARETGVEVVAALTVIGDAIRHLSNGFREIRDNLKE